MKVNIILFLLILFLHNTISWKSIHSVPKRYEIIKIHSSKNNLIEEESTLSIPPWIPSFGTAALGGLLFGIDIGSSSSALRILGLGSSDLGSLTSLQLGEIASASLLGAILSSAGIAVIGDLKIGRKLELIIAAIAFGVGTLVQSTSTSFEPELIGRLIYGLGIGVAMHVAPLFIAETSPNNLRGKLVSFKEAAIVLGIVAGYASGSIFGGNGDWQAVFRTAIPFEALMLVGALTVSESPRWLALRGREEEARKVLSETQDLSKEEAKRSVEAMVEAAKSNESKSIQESTNPFSPLKEILDSKYNRRALLIGIGLVLFQQLSGQPSVLYFANRIFEQAGLGFEAAVGVGLFKLIMTILSASLVENPKFGRKSLLLYGNVGLTISLGLLSFLYYNQPQGELISGNLLQSQFGIIAAMFLFVGSYQIGFGPITWLILSEIFPLRVRSGAISLGAFTNFASNLLVTLVFESERQLLGEPLLFLQFALISLLSVIFTSIYVFETRGLSLEQIEEKLKEQVNT